MGFTTPCFIRKNTPELRKKLEKLGYKSRTISNNDKLCLATTANNVYAKYTIITNEMFDSVDPHRTWNCAGRIDCGTNEMLFIALAALRDDTDNNQLFTNGKGYWGIYWDSHDGGLSGMNFFGIPNDFDLSNYHKATVNELIEYFKEEEE